MVHIYPFKKSDIFDLMDMYISQNTQAPETFPEIGFIVRDNEGTAIAAGFLRKVEGNQGLIDAYVTNSKASAENRHNAIDLLTQTIIATAKNMGISLLMLHTQIESIAIRAVEQGFIVNPHVIMGLKLD